MDTKKLRQKILDLAIRGKLVPPACRQAGKTLTMNPLPRTECKKCWYTYVIECEDGSFYKGFTDNLVRRYEQHCNGTGAEHTKKHKPKQLFYWEMHYSQEEAVAREKFLKSGVGREWFKREVVDKPESWEPASALLERIRAEKERLIKEGKTRLSGRQVKRSKKSASDTPRYENLSADRQVVPFEVPESWEWTTIEDVTVNRDSERIPLSLAVRKKQQNKIYDYYGAAGIIDKVENYLFDERLLLVGEDGANLLSRSKDNAFFAEGKYWVNNHAHVLDCPNKSVLDYVAFVINSMSLKNYITGSAQPKLTQDNLNKILIPLPPEKEQHRIIESVNNYFSYISLLEGEKEEMDSFILKAKSKILDLAIHGKLIPQDPHDEPAIELLKRINPKFTPCDNAHYENVPSNWAVCKVKDVFMINPKTKADDGMEAGFVPMSNIKDSYNNNFSYELRTWGNIKKGYTHFENGDIVVAKISPCLENRKSAVISGLPNGIGAGTTELNVFRSDYVHPLYCLFFFKSDYFISKCVGTFNGVVGQQRVSTKTIEDIAFPVPPRSEQERIINKVNELFQILDKISAEL